MTAMPSTLLVPWEVATPDVVVLAIDPGPARSAWIVVGPNGGIRAFAIWPNEGVIDTFRQRAWSDDITVVVIEKVESFGMTVGAEVFETVFWSGRFAEAAHPLPVERIGRMAVKHTLCHTAKAKDPQIRQALIDRYSGGLGKAAAIGTTKSRGPLYGLSNDVWSALAVAVTYRDKLVGL